MKDTKRRVVFFSFYDHTGIERHLNKMAKQGWLIESITNVCWTYRKIEPKDIHFSASYYPRGSDFDPEPTEDQQTFHDFCAHTGWTYACSWFQMQIFYNEKENPIPLDTDPEMEVDVIHKACKKNFLPGYFLLLAVSLLMTVYFIWGVVADPIGLLSSASRLMSQSALLCLFALCAVELVTYFRWHRKAKLAAKNGIFVATSSTTKFHLVIMGILLIITVFGLVNLFAGDDPLLFWLGIVNLVYMFGLILAVNGIKQGLKKAKVSRGWNKVVTFGACFLIPIVMTVLITLFFVSFSDANAFDRKPGDHDKIPLSVADFIEINEKDYVTTNSNNETFLLGQRRVNQFPHWDLPEFHELPDLQYTVTTVKVPFLYDWCKEQKYWDADERNNNIPAGHRLVYKEVDATPWGAGEAYRIYHEEGWWMDWYLLCYENAIVAIQFDWEPTAEDMAIVAEKLNP